MGDARGRLAERTRRPRWLAPARRGGDTEAQAVASEKADAARHLLQGDAFLAPTELECLREQLRIDREDKSLRAWDEARLEQFKRSNLITNVRQWGLIAATITTVASLHDAGVASDAWQTVRSLWPG